MPPGGVGEHQQSEHRLVSMGSAPAKRLARACGRKSLVECECAHIGGRGASLRAMAVCQNSSCRHARWEGEGNGNGREGQRTCRSLLPKAATRLGCTSARMARNTRLSAMAAAALRGSSGRRSRA